MEDEARALAGLLGSSRTGSAFDELLDTRNRVESILQVVVGSDGILVQDFSGRIAFANAPAAEILGAASIEALLRTSPIELMNHLHIEEEASGEVLEELPGTAVLRGASASERTLQIRRASDRPRWVTARTLPMPDHGGELAASITIFRDVTEQRRDADFREKVLAIVSHDLRTPLTAITLTAALIRRRAQKFAPWIAEAALRIQRSSERAERMVRDLLDLTQARQGGGLRVVRHPIDVLSLAEGVVDELLAAHPQRAIVLHHTGAGTAHWDSDRIRQVLINLLNNALTYAPRDSEIRINIAGEADVVAIGIQNQGPPIPPQQLDTLFEPFVRGERKSSAERSVGLGLYIVKEIVTTHQGAIAVSSNADDGTTFTVHLPRREQLPGTA